MSIKQVENFMELKFKLNDIIYFAHKKHSSVNHFYGEND